MSTDLWWDDAKIRADVDRYGNEAIREACEDLRSESIAVCPIEESTLIHSASVEVDGLEGVVYYDTVYAVVQHEDLTFRHDEGRTAKYLEGPLRENKDRLERHIIAGALKKAFR